MPPTDTVHFCETYSGAAIICQDNYFWLQKIRRDFGVVFERELAEKGIPAENRVETYKQYWKDAHNKLLSCARDGSLECVETLLQIGVNPNVQSRLGITALMVTTYAGYLDIVRLLLEHDADPNIQDKWGNTALKRASDIGHIDIVRLLLDHGAKQNLQNKLGQTALDIAEEEGHLDIVLLMDPGADPGCVRRHPRQRRRRRDPHHRT